MRRVYYITVALFLISSGLVSASQVDAHKDAQKNRPPSQLAAEVINSNTAKLSWIGTPKDYAYRLRVRPEGVLTWTYYNVKAPTSTRRISDLIPGTVYHWQVQAQYSDRSRDTSEYSTGKTFTAWEPCAVPQNPMAFINEPTRVWLTWFGSENTLYTVRLRAKDDKTWIKYETTNNGIWIDNLDPHTEYDVNVTSHCINSDMDSETSETIHFNTASIALVETTSSPMGSAENFSPERLITFSSESERTYPVEAKLLNPMGNHVETLPVYYSSSNGNVAFDINSDLPPGLYNVSYRCGMDVQSQTVMIAAQ